VFAHDSKVKITNRLLALEYFGYPRDFLQQYQAKLAAVTRADVLRVAKQHLDPARFTTVVVGRPEQFDKPLDALGSPVTALDLTITPSKPQAVEPDATGLDNGKKLLQRWQQAAGGTAKLEAVKDYTRVLEYQLTAEAGGGQAQETERWIAPGTLRQDAKLPAGSLSVYYDSRYGWIANDRDSGPLTDWRLKQVQGDHFRVYFSLLLSDRVAGRVISALDDETLEIRDAQGHVARIVLDVETGLPRRMLFDMTPASGIPVAVEENYTEYRETEGIKMPHRATVLQGGRKYAEMSVSSIRINTGLNAAELMRRPR
jgi:hypothetical protein